MLNDLIDDFDIICMLIKIGAWVIFNGIGFSLIPQNSKTNIEFLHFAQQYHLHMLSENLVSLFFFLTKMCMCVRRSVASNFLPPHGL